MAGMYPENEEITVFGERVQWPGVDRSGKFTNGSFSDPHEPPSFIPANTINLILDNLSGLITKLGGIPDNSSIEQLAGVFTSNIKANAGIMRDAAGRAKVAPPEAKDDIARKAEVDTEAQARTSGDNAITQGLSAHAGNKNNPHGVTASQVGLGNVDNTRDNQKSVKYAASAGNSDSVCGFSAGNGAGMLVPVVAFNSGANAGYIKLGNGLIVQWGSVMGDEVDVKLPVAYTKDYSISISTNAYSDHDDWSRTGTYMNKTLNTFHISVCMLNKKIQSTWITIGI